MNGWRPLRPSFGQEERQAMAARDVGLKPADFDAMTAAAWIECGDFRKVNEHEGLGFRSVPAGWQAGV